MSTPTEILDAAFQRASINIIEPIIKNPDIVNKIEYVCRFLGNLVLEEPESAVSQPLKEAFLALRQAAESGE